MTHEEQRIWLVRQLLCEDAGYSRYHVPEDAQGQKDLLRALMNVRPPKPISEEVLAVQDEYLTEDQYISDNTDYGRIACGNKNCVDVCFML